MCLSLPYELELVSLPGLPWIRLHGQLGLAKVLLVLEVAVRHVDGRLDGTTSVQPVP